MRKLKLQMQVTVDGFVAGPSNEMDWMQFNWDDELNKYVAALTEPVDTILLGRKLAEGFIPVWKSRAEDPEAGEDFAHKMTETPKIVFTRTLQQTDWENTELACNENLQELITQLKQKPGGNIMVYGGVDFVADLISEGLIDEYNLFVNPAAIGTGRSIFKELINKVGFKLVEARSFECGVALLKYQYDK